MPEEEETFPIGKSQIVREGKDVTLISYGTMMRPTLEAARILKEKDDVEAEVIDLLTLSPLDDSLFTESVRKTGRAVIVHEAPRSYGPGAEILSKLVDRSFYYLEAPVARVTGFDVVTPLFSRENYYIPGVDRILLETRRTLKTH